VLEAPPVCDKLTAIASEEEEALEFTNDVAEEDDESREMVDKLLSVVGLSESKAAIPDRTAVACPDTSLVDPTEDND